MTIDRTLVQYQLQIVREKRRDLTQSYDKNPLHQLKCQKGKVTTKTTPQKSSITQQLRTALGRSVGIIVITDIFVV